MNRLAAAEVAATRLVRRQRSPGAGTVPDACCGLPPDLLLEASRRLRALCLVFAGTFFLANFVAPSLAGYLDEIMSMPARWLPGALSIAMATIVFLVASSNRLSPPRVMDLGLLLGVVGSYGIAAAEYVVTIRTGHVTHEQWEMSGLSWVAVWMVSFSIIVPNTPRKTLVAASLSASAVPVTIALAYAASPYRIEATAAEFVAGLVIPYAICAVISYVASRIVYRLGSAVARERELGSYRLVERLGAGGMGEVWRAHHRLLARPAAIKLVRPELLAAGTIAAARTAMRRFEREAQATAMLRSPHTIDLYDFGIADDGTFYYVMELLDGLDLGTLVERFGPLEAARVVHILRQICDSIGEAHAAGLIHRDIKPANVFVCRQGRAADFVKVLDFGLVKPRDAIASGDPGLTAVGGVGGTPAFMAPEQALGKGPVDARSDIYAIGCLAYWLLTGELVFTGDTPVQIILRHLENAPAPPSSRTEISVPPALDAIVLDCLAKDPESRPASADALAARLETCVERGLWTGDRALEWWDAHCPRQEMDTPIATAGDSSAFDQPPP